MQTVFLLSLGWKKKNPKDLERLHRTKNDCTKTMLKNDDLVHILNHRKISVRMLPKLLGRRGLGPRVRAGGAGGGAGRLWVSVGEQQGGDDGVIVSDSDIVTAGTWL